MLRAIPLLLLAGALWAQGRPDPWTRLEKMDSDGDGKVSKEEFFGPDRLWSRLDGDGDGFVTKEEAGAMRRGGGGPGRGGMRDRAARTEQRVRRFDGDGDGTISAAEWNAFFEKADSNGDGVLDREELAAALGGRAYNDTAPQVGDAAPKVKAKEAKSGGEVDLAAPRRTTVLAFGSWT